MENISAVLYGPDDIRIENTPKPVIENANDVIVKVSCVGICGSDVKLWSTGRCGVESVNGSLIIGHEGAGVVVEVGANVKSLKVGDRVAIEPTQPCRHCEWCKQGRYNLCQEPRYCATSYMNGNLCRYYRHVADFCHKLPENITLEEGAAMQPLAIAIHAGKRAGVKIGSSVAIIGGGPIGLLCAMVARAMGAANILISDRVPARLTTAMEMVSCKTLISKKEDTEEDTVSKIIEIMGGRPDITFEACGYGSAQSVAMLVTKTGGTVVVVGIADAVVEVPLSQAMIREVDVRGSYRIAGTYKPALEALSTGVLSLKKFITHHFDIQQTREALKLAKSGEAMKIIIHIRD